MIKTNKVFLLLLIASICLPNFFSALVFAENTFIINFIQIGSNGELNQNHPKIKISVTDSYGNPVSGVSIQIETPDYPSNYWGWSSEQEGDYYLITATRFPGLALREEFTFTFVKSGFTSKNIKQELAINSNSISILNEYGNFVTHYNKKFNMDAFPSSLAIGDTLQEVYVDSTKYYVTNAYYQDTYNGYIVLDTNFQLVTNAEIMYKSMFTSHIGQYLANCFSAYQLSQLSELADDLLLVELQGYIAVSIRDTFATAAGYVIGKQLQIPELIPNKEQLSDEILQNLDFQDSWLDFMKANVLWWISPDPPYPSYFEFSATVSKELFRISAVDRISWAGSIYQELALEIEEYSGETRYEYSEINLMYEKWVTASANMITSIGILDGLHPDATFLGQLTDITLNMASGATGLPISTLFIDCPDLAKILVRSITDHKLLRDDFYSFLREWELSSNNVRSAVINNGDTQIIESYTINNDFIVTARNGDSASATVYPEALTTSFTVYVEQISGSTSNVELSCTGQHPTWTVSFSKQSGTPTFTSTLTITATTSIFGDFLLTITGRDGTKTRTCTVNVNVQNQISGDCTIDPIPSPQYYGAWYNFHGYYPEQYNDPSMALIAYWYEYDTMGWWVYGPPLLTWEDPTGPDQWATGHIPIIFHEYPSVRNTYDMSYPIIYTMSAKGYSSSVPESNKVSFEMLKAPTSTAIQVSPNAIVLGNEIKINGKLKSDYGYSGATYALEGTWTLEYSQGSTWNEISSGQVYTEYRYLVKDSGGVYIVYWAIDYDIPEQTWYPPESREYEIRMRFHDARNYEDSVSAIHVITVTPNTYDLEIQITGLPSHLSTTIYENEAPIGTLSGGSSEVYDGFLVNELYSIAVDPIILESPGTRYIAETHTTTVEDPMPIVFTYMKEYLFTTEVLPEGGGEISTTGLGWLPADSTVDAIASDISGYSFSYWETNNDFYDNTQTISLLLDQPIHLTAFFESPSHIELDTSLGSVGSTVVVSGEGWTSGVITSITLGGIECYIFDAPVLISESGVFSCSIIVPQTPYQGAFDLRVESNEGEYGTETFTVIERAEIIIDPFYGVQGSRVQLGGSNFVQGSVDIYFGDIYFGDTYVDTLGVGSDGSFSDMIRIPAIMDGWYIVSARQEEYNIVAETDFRVGIIIVILDKSMDVVGAEVAILGAGFTEGGTWSATFGGIPILEDQPVDSETCHISGAFLVPNVENGVYDVCVIDDLTGIVVTNQFVVIDSTTNVASFGIRAYYMAETSSDSLPPDYYDYNMRYDLWTENDADINDYTLLDPGFYVEATGVTSPTYPEYCTWDEYYAEWDFPPSREIPEDDVLVTSFESTELTLMPAIIDMTRAVTPETLSSDGVQTVTLAVKFNYLFTPKIMVNISAPPSHSELIASFIPGSESTDAPILDTIVTDSRVCFILDLIYLEEDVTYTFSAQCNVGINEVEASSIHYKPVCSVDIRTHTYYAYLLGYCYTAVMPNDLLPYGVSYAEASTQSNNLWYLHSHSTLLFTLEEVCESTSLTSLSLVVRGGDDRIYYNVWDDEGSAWTGWVKLPGSTPGKPAAATIRTDLHLVVRGSDGGIYHGVVDLGDDSFSGWTKFPGGTPSAPSLAATESGLILTVRGNDNRVYYSLYDGSWSSWKKLPGTTPDAVGTSVIGDTYHVMVRGSDSKMYHGTMTVSTETFHGWTLMTGTTPSQPVLCDDESSLYLVVRGSNNGIYWSEYTGSWSVWTKVSGSTAQSPGAAVHGDDLWICVTGVSTGFYYGYVDMDTSIWSGWGYLGGSSPSPPTLMGE